MGAGGIGEIDVIESCPVDCVDLMKTFLDMENWSKTIMCQFQTQGSRQGYRLVSQWPPPCLCILRYISVPMEST